MSQFVFVRNVSENPTSCVALNNTVVGKRFQIKAGATEKLTLEEFSWFEAMIAVQPDLVVSATDLSEPVQESDESVHVDAIDKFDEPVQKTEESVQEESVVEKINEPAPVEQNEDKVLESINEPAPAPSVDEDKPAKGKKGSKKEAINEG